jgi:C1A family cysteine protease
MSTYTPQHVYDLKPSKPDSRDFRAMVSHYPPPPSEAVIPFIPPCRDQGQEGACWGFCGTGGRASYAIAAGDNTLLSPAFLYWQTREAMGDDRDDTGSDMRTGLDTMLKVGICPESAMPYQAGRFADVPSADAVAQAARYRIATYARVMDMDTLKGAIAAGHPVLLGISVYRGFETTRDGIVPPPNAGEMPLGGHAILAVGYKDDATEPSGGRIQLLNSWGTAAGDGRGFYYVPYSYLNFAAGASGALLSEAWVISIP